MLLLQPEKSPGQKDTIPADGTWLPVATNGDNGTSRLHGSSRTVAPSNFQLYQHHGAPERLLLQITNPCAEPIDRKLPV